MSTVASLVPHAQLPMLPPPPLSPPLPPPFRQSLPPLPPWLEVLARLPPLSTEPLRSVLPQRALPPPPIPLLSAPPWVGLRQAAVPQRILPSLSLQPQLAFAHPRAPSLSWSRTSPGDTPSMDAARAVAAASVLSTKSELAVRHCRAEDGSFREFADQSSKLGNNRLDREPQDASARAVSYAHPVDEATLPQH